MHWLSFKPVYLSLALIVVGIFADDNNSDLEESSPKYSGTFLTCVEHCHKYYYGSQQVISCLDGCKFSACKICYKNCNAKYGTCGGKYEAQSTVYTKARDSPVSDMYTFESTAPTTAVPNTTLSQQGPSEYSYSSFEELPRSKSSDAQGSQSITSKTAIPGGQASEFEASAFTVSPESSVYQSQSLGRGDIGPNVSKTMIGQSMGPDSTVPKPQATEYEAQVPNSFNMWNPNLPNPSMTNEQFSVPQSTPPAYMVPDPNAYGMWNMNMPPIQPSLPETYLPPQAQPVPQGYPEQNMPYPNMPQFQPESSYEQPTPPPTPVET